MKNKILIILSGGLLAFAFGCDKDPAVVSKVVEESFPQIVLNGGEVTVVAAGQAFADPGAKVNPGYTEDGTLVDPSAAPSISINADSIKLGTEEGIYFVPYTYRNKYGFETSVNRKVVVVDSAYTSNFAGTWKRAATGGLCIWKNLGSGVHEIQNPGGVDITISANAVFGADKMYVIIKNNNSVICPVQELAGTHATITKLNSVDFKPTQVKYALAASSAYGTAVRTFDKQ